MNFENVIEDIKELKGLTLTSITPSTPPIVLVDINLDENKFFLLNSTGKSVGRSLNQLKEVWKSLQLNGFVNVDQALYGSGSSRNQPETIIAHLPYVQHFKYKQRKHLLLRKKKVHASGTLSELTHEETKRIKKQIDNQKSIQLEAFGNSLGTSVDNLNDSLSSIYEKYPGEAELHVLTKVMEGFRELKYQVDASVVGLDVESIGVSVEEKEVEIPPSLESLIDLPEVTGVDDTKEGDETDDVFEPTSILKPRVRRQTPAFSLIYDRLIYNEIEIQPEYQRKDRIWKLEQRSRLIESILIGLPLPIFYFGERKNGNWAVIDGLQRITTIQDFMQDKFSLYKLEEATEYEGIKYSQLSRIDTRKIREFELTAYIVDIEEGKERFITELFHRINTYGVKLSPQEIRTAIHLGNSVTFLKYLAASQPFISATHNKINPERQKDIELCLGAISYMIFGFKNFNFSRYDDFLRNGMRWLNEHSIKIEVNDDGTQSIKDISNQLNLLARSYVKALQFSQELFGDDAFKKQLYSDSTAPVNKPLFELIVSVFSFLSDKQKEKLIINKLKFLDVFFGAIESDSEKYAIWESTRYSDQNRGFNYSISLSTGKRVTVVYRFESLIKMLESILDEPVKFDGVGELSNA